MANQEQKLAIWRNLGKDFGSPPKDSDEYYRKMETYYQILEELNQPLPPPPQRMPARMPVEVRRVEPDEEVPRQKGECYCDCHRNERAPLAPVRRRVVRDSSDSEESEFGDVRLARRGRRVILTSDDESSSDSDSDDEPVRTKKPVGRPSKKSTAVQKVKKAPKEEKKKKSTVPPPKKKQTSRA